jgi:EAL domain-containing protein (putative c-di-GMP-specific phosphodiesterase class I)
MNGGCDKRQEQIKWFLEQVSGAAGELRIAIDAVPYTIGRDEECNLRLQSNWVSRRHAEIRSSGEMLWIRDLGSTNGTLVNRKPVRGSDLLESGDMISFGKSEFYIRSVNTVRPSIEAVTAVVQPVEDLMRLTNLEPVLRELLRERNVTPHFQPVVRFSDMQVIGYEVLSRIGEGALPANPSELFEVAACLGCASDLSALVREKGVDLARSLPSSSLLFVNTDPVELDQVDVLLKSLGVASEMAHSNRIVLEISEKAVPQTEEMMGFRDRLAELDIALAFDDFGVGQTRLVELAKAPPDFLKFDISLIRQIHLAPKRLHQMVYTFVTAAQDLGIATVAEGIECPDEAETCRQIGFDYAQGYYYGKPSPISEFAVRF